MLNPFDPMPTIKAILGMTMAQDITESVLLAELDDFKVPQCEVPGHNNITTTPDHSGPAGFFLITPCHHREGYLCTPIAEWLKAHGDLTCECGQRLHGADLTFIPIGGTS